MSTTELVFHEPQKLALSEVNPAPYNPRFISKEDEASLRASMLEHGLVLHFVVQKEADDGTPMVMIGGHQRLNVAKKLCAEKGWELPATGWGVVLDVTDSKAKRLNVALNRISGEFDSFLLGRLFKDIAAEMSIEEATATGFRPGEIDELIAQCRDPDEILEDYRAAAEQIELEGFAKSITLTVLFDTVERRDAVKAKLKELLPDGSMPGPVIEKALVAYAASKKRMSAAARKKKR